MKKRLLGLLSIIMVALTLIACGKSYTVTFDVDGGTPAVEAQTIKKDGLVTKPSDPSKEGYTFEFWALKDSNSEYNFSTKVTKGLELVAKWEINSYLVTFNARGGSATPDDQTVEYKGKATLPTEPTLAGNQFLGWFVVGKDEAYDFNSEVKGNLSLEARWSLDEFTITFDVKGGLPVPEVQTIVYNERGTAPTNPTKEGHDFLGWYEVGGVEEFNFFTRIKEDVVLEARWEIHTFTVTFDPNEEGIVGVPRIVNYNEKVPKPESPTHPKATFLGWYVGEALFDFNTPIKQNYDLVGKWEYEEIVVSFDAKEGTPEPEPQTLIYGEKVVKPTDPTREIATFMGWFLDGEEYDFDALVEDDMVLEARWEIKYAELLADIAALYEETFNNHLWKAVEDVELIKDIKGVPITWESNNKEFFSNEGVVVRPTYSVGNQTITLIAELTPVHQEYFFFVVESLEQTTEEKIDSELDRITTVPTSITGFQEENFDVIEEVTFGEDKVDVIWTTSDADLMTAKGVIIPFEDAPFKIAILTASITYEGVTRTREVEFKIKGVSTYSSFKDALIGANDKEKIKVENVAVFGDLDLGYYLIAEDGSLGYAHIVRKDSEVPKGKIFDVMFTVNLYYNAFQIASVAVSNVRDGEMPEKVFEELDFDDIVEMPIVSASNLFNHLPFNIGNLKVYVDHDPKDDRYDTYLVQRDFDLARDGISKSTAILIYYPSEREYIRNLDEIYIDSINLVMNGYRDDLNIWYANFFNFGDDIEYSLNDEQKVKAALDELKGNIPHAIIKAEDLTLSVDAFDATIVWESDDLAVIGLDGKVVIPTAGKVVTLTATITAGGEEEVFTREVWVGTPEELEVTKIEDVHAYDGVLKLKPFKVKGVVTGMVGNGTYSLQDDTGALAIYWNKDFAELEFGYEYTIIGVKDVYSGLVQIRQGYEAVKGDAKPLPTPVVLTEANLKDAKFMLTVQAHLISIPKVEITKVTRDSYNTTSITFKKGTATIDFRWDNRITSIGPEGTAFLNALKVGDFIDIVGAPLGWFKAPQISFSDASQLQEVEPDTDLEAVNSVIAGLDIPLYTAVDLTLPIEGKFGSTISWVSSDVLVIDNTGKVTVQEENVTITLTATVTRGTESKDVSYHVLVQADANYVNVRITRSLAIDTLAKFVGLVTGFGASDYVYVADPDGVTITMFKPEKPEGLKVGDRVEVTGKVANHNGLIQIGEGGVIVIIDSDNAIPLAVEVDKIPALTVDDQGRNYNIENLFVKSVNGRTMIVTDLINDVTVYVDPNNAALVTYLAGAVDKKVDLVGIRVGWFGGKAQFLMHEEANVVIKLLNDEDKIILDLFGLELPDRITSDDPILLPAKGDLSDKPIEWSSSHPDIIAADGTVVIPEDDTLVTLTATIMHGLVSLNKKLKILVRNVEFEEFIATASYSGATTNLDENQNVAGDINLDKTIFDVEALKGAPGNNIGLNKDGQIRLYSVRASGQGNTLIVKIAEGYTIIGVEFNFVAANNKANSAELKIGEQTINLNEADLTMKQVYEDLETDGFELFNSHQGGTANGQIWITSIVITYIQKPYVAPQA